MGKASMRVLRWIGRAAAVVMVPVMVAWAGEPAGATGPVDGERFLVSVDGAGVLGNDTSYGGVLSADGRFLAFTSWASNLVPNDTNGHRDVFVKDLRSGTTERVSVSTAGTEANSPTTGRPAISADGRYVAFDSFASNLVWNDGNGRSDVFVRDRMAMTTTRVSMSSAFVEGNGDSLGPAISEDGRRVAFTSAATNLVRGDTNGRRDVFVRDLLPRWPATTRVSVSDTGEQGNLDSRDPSISGDGQFVTFTSDATNLEEAEFDGNVVSDVFLRDRTAGTTTLLSYSILIANSGNGPSANAEISADGRWIVYDSFASDLVVDDLGARDVFRKDRTAGHATKISVTHDGSLSTGASFEPTVSNDGTVAFSSNSTNLTAAGDTNNTVDVFVRSGQSTYLMTRTGVNGGFGGGWWPAISADGQALVFNSGNSDLVPNDTNQRGDLFVSGPRSAFCMIGSGRTLDCDLTARPEAAPTTVQWYFDGVHDPSLDNQTVVQVAVACQPKTIHEVRAVIGGPAGLAQVYSEYLCPPP
jgi:Tol biopolymer transport system component